MVAMSLLCFAINFIMKKFLNNNLVGMTLLEIIVVISIIGFLVTIVTVSMSDVREQSRDSQRISDVTQIQVALSAYKRDTGLFPLAITGGQELRSSSTVYMTKIPVPPTPQDGICGLYPVYASYRYQPAPDLKSYNLYFCLGGKTSDILSGSNKAMDTGVTNSLIPN
jgi:type II secretory pathway pseudopilin PulG